MPRQTMKKTLHVFIGMLICASSLAQKPIITSTDRITGANGDVVTIQGSGFGTTANDLAVFFGAAKASVNFVSEQLIEAVIPAGATYDKISVARLSSGLSTYTKENFLMSFGGEPGITAAKFEGQ